MASIKGLGPGKTAAARQFTVGKQQRYERHEDVCTQSQQVIQTETWPPGSNAPRSTTSA